MAKMTMTTYLDNYLNKTIPDYEIALDWDTKNHTIEIIFRLYAENKEQIEISDVDGVASDEIIEFEDGILLYDPKKSQFDAEDYLATIPYEGKKGLPENHLRGIVDYLKEVLDDGQSDLLDFLTSDAEVFELTWNTEKYQTYIKGDANSYIPYPSY
ncbi:DUF3013 family protein [Enterococcus sp. AZ103]|uniref:DUF3013 family protein n=1 Tax=Enterococcus sp. AZ103 TaxID=2774628 RepID=UPI003F23A15E